MLHISIPECTQVKQKFFLWCKNKNKNCVPDPRHVTCTPSCKFWECKQQNAFVCKCNFSVHFCGSKCKIPPIELPNKEGYACPLTQQVHKDRVMVNNATFGKDGKMLFTWGFPHKIKTRGPKKTVTKKKEIFSENECYQMMLDCLTGTHRQKMRKIQLKRACKNIEKHVKRVYKNNKLITFCNLRHIIHTARQKLGPKSLKESRYNHIKELSKKITQHVHKHPECFVQCKEVIVATWLTLLSTGVTVDNIVVIKKDECIAEHMPPPALMAMLPKVHCRSISVAVRRFKDYVTTPKGNVIHDRIFSFGLDNNPQPKWNLKVKESKHL